MRINLSKHVTKKFILRLISLVVFFNGLLILLDALTSHVAISRRSLNLHSFRFSIPIIIGITLVYLATLLNRRKQAAWALTLTVYSVSLGINLALLSTSLYDRGSFALGVVVRRIIFPAAVLISLAYYHKEYNIKSDIRNFAISLRISLVVLIIAFLYGIIGFNLLDIRDFHEEIGLLQSAHYTIDQFGLTTPHVLNPHTDRARLFLSSLTLISVVSAFYVLVSLFQPLKARFTNQTSGREQMRKLLGLSSTSSEDFFKLWPYDKTYLFDYSGDSGVAFRVEKGVALSMGDPAGRHNIATRALKAYEDMCRTNDWLPAFIRTEPSYSSFYKQHGYGLQKIGQEAVVDIKHFEENVVRNKYFRNIVNKFTKQDYVTEALLPPHNSAVISRLTDISNDWIGLPGRSERGFMMGYFNAEYMQQCTVFVLRDAAGTIQAFINQVPSFDHREANYDLLRYGKSAPGNSNDYLLLNFIHYLGELGFETLNLGLSPLVGMDEASGEKSVIDAAMRLLYSRGDRFYSFSGLHRFKDKYEPVWTDRFIAYKGGVRGFTRTVNALNKAMTRSAKI
jgi:phosphatidylglycerol lysyltransferase